jgi:predicted esterase
MVAIVFLRKFLFAWIALSFILQVSESSAQSPEQRYQLGRRLTRFEQQWQQADNTTRVRTTSAMQSAVSSFFSLQLDVATSKLDEAWLIALGTDREQLQERVSDTSWFVRTSPLIQDSKTTTRRFLLERVPKQPNTELPNGSVPKDGLTLQIEIRNVDDKVVCKDQRVVAASQMSWEWHTGPLAEGDYRVHATLQQEGKTIDIIANRFSVIAESDTRLAAIRTPKETPRLPVADTKNLTRQAIMKMISTGDADRLAESDMPFHTLLQDYEFLLDEGHTIREWLTQRSKSSFWLQLGRGKSKQYVRFQSPNPRTVGPIVVAYHGAGGSENMFFESYGAGGLIDLCMRNGWSVVAPRQTLLGTGMELDALLDELQVHLPFDPSRVFIVGHSMGAAQAIAQVSRHADRVRAVAAIGGGGSPTKSDELIKIPFFVAAGEKDFGLPRAKALATTLKNYGAKVDFEEVKDVEHMVIVQAVLGEIEQFFKQQSD